MIWLEWVAIEPENEILAVTIYKERNRMIIEIFLSGLIKDYGKHYVSTDGGGVCYPMACEFLKLDHHIQSFLVKKRKD